MELVKKLISRRLLAENTPADVNLGKIYKSVQ